MQQSPTRKWQVPAVLGPLVKKHRKPMKGLPLTGMRLNILPRFANSESLKSRISSIHDEANQTINYPLHARGFGPAKTEHSNSMNRYQCLLESKEEKILGRVLNRQNKRYKQSGSPELNHSYSLNRRADNCLITLDGQTKKPNDSYLLELENLRSAERSLLTNPRNEIARVSTSKSYLEHEQANRSISRLDNISRRGVRNYGSQQTQQQRRHRQKWCHH